VVGAGAGEQVYDVEHWPDWADREAGRVRLTGRALATIGLPAPLFADKPGNAFLLEALRM
jgi:hypothetical protein